MTNPKGTRKENIFLKCEAALLSLFFSFFLFLTNYVLLHKRIFESSTSIAILTSLCYKV